MSWLELWRAISARIEGLVGAGDLMVATFQVDSSDPFNIARGSVVPELNQLREELRRLQRDYGAMLPSDAAAALDRFLQRWGVDHQAMAGGEVHSIRDLVPFAVFRSEFEYLIRDTELEARTLTELAFEHLRRVLAVDFAVRKTWEEAFKHETRCEKLGAVHLLSHGIWAFKAAQAGATDLVFGEPIESEEHIIRRTARALVLTEWKCVREASELEEKAEEGRRQAELYATGVLGDLELKKTRYIVLVSEKTLPVPADHEITGVTSRHVILPFNPDTPSKEARS